jgi:hypothetical protein
VQKVRLADGTLLKQNFYTIKCHSDYEEKTCRDIKDGYVVVDVMNLYIYYSLFI